MAKTKKQKTDALEQFKKDSDASQAVIFADYKGLGVNAMNTLRKELDKENAKMTVIKNTLVNKANDKVNLTGETIVIFTNDKIVEPIKVLYKFIKENNLPVIKSAIVENELVGKEKVDMLATLPSMNELRAKMLGSLMSPVRNFVGVSSNVYGSFARVLNGIVEKSKI